MSLRNQPKKIFRILLLEDELTQARRIVEAVEDSFTSGAASLGEFAECRLAVTRLMTVSELGEPLFTEHFHFLILDLRVPMFAGDALTAEPVGLASTMSLLSKYSQMRLTVKTSGAVLTQLTQARSEVSSEAESSGLECWEKAAGDADETLLVPRLNSEMVARFVLGRLQHFGPAMHSSCTALAECIPKPAAALCVGIAPVCVSAQAWRDTRGNAPRQQGLLDAMKGQRRVALSSLMGVCRLAEMTGAWLLALVAARIAVSDAPAMALADFAGGRTHCHRHERSWQSQALMTVSIQELMQVAAQDNGQRGFQCQRLFSHLEVNPIGGDTEFAFVEALHRLRALRNDWRGAESADNLDAEWSEAILPLRRVLDGLLLFSSHTLVSRLQVVAPGYLRMQRFDSVRPMEAQISVVRVGNEDSQGDELEADPQQVYVLWPRRDGRADLLPLWPWVARLSLTKEGPLQTYFYVGRDESGDPIGLEIGLSAKETFSEGSDAARWRQALDEICASASHRAGSAPISSEGIAHGGDGRFSRI